MQWAVRLETRTDQGEAEITELVTFSRPVVAGTLADLGLALAEAKAVLAKLQGITVQSQVAEYVAYHRVCSHCRVPQPLRGCTQIELFDFNALMAGRHKTVAAQTVRGKSAALKMPAQDIGPTWGDWSDAAFCVGLNTNKSVISRTASQGPA